MLPVAALRAPRQRRDIALVARHEPERQRAEAVTDADEPRAVGSARQVVERAADVLFRPVAHARLEAAQPCRPRTADAAVVEGERREAASRQVFSELAVVLLLYAGSRLEQH